MAYVITTRPSLPRYSVTTTEYCGSCVYRGGSLQRVLIPGGYATPKTGGGFDYHYYVCDYLGSVRAVVAEDGTVEESSDYYPYGMQMPGTDGEMQRKQPYKFGGKEHLNAGGLNIHDFGPRALYAPAGQFASADPKCEDYPHLSPYVYCAANPVNLTDPSGMDIYIPRGIGIEKLDEIIKALSNLTSDNVYFKDDGDFFKVEVSKSTNSIKYSAGTKLLRTLTSCKERIEIDHSNLSGHFSKDEKGFLCGRGRTGIYYVNYDNTEVCKMLTTNEEIGYNTYQDRPDYIGLGHELIHVYRMILGTHKETKRDKDNNIVSMLNLVYTDAAGDPVNEWITFEDFFTIGIYFNDPSAITENALRKEHKLGRRVSYSDFY